MAVAVRTGERDHARDSRHNGWNPAHDRRRLNHGFASPSVSPDGKRIAYETGQFGWDVLEISIPNGEVRTLVSGGISRMPDWAPSGTHFIFSIPTGEGAGIVDRQAGVEGFSRRLGDARGNNPQWSPDGGRFVFYREVDRIGRLMLANATGGGIVVLDSQYSPEAMRGMSWSPDGQWISYLREISGKQDLVKIRATPGAAPEIVGERQASDLGRLDAPMVARGRLDRVSGRGWHRSDFAGWQIHAQPDFTQIPGLRVLEGRQPVLRCLPKHTGNGAQWQLYSVNVKIGRREISGAHRSFRFRGSYGRIQHPSRRQALPHLRGQVPIRYLDARRLRAAGAKELSGPAAASLRCKRLRLSSTTMCGCEASPILSGSSDTRRMGGLDIV